MFHIFFCKRSIQKVNSKQNHPPPNQVIYTLSQDVQKLHIMVAARYVGAASIIKFKTPKEGLQHQMNVLEGVKMGHIQKQDKIYRLGKEQQEVFNSRLHSYCNFGGHGTGAG